MIKLLYFISDLASIFLKQLGLIDFRLLGDTLSNIALLLIGVIITIFVLSVTLLGKAAKISRETKAETEQKSRQEFEKHIELLRQKIKNKPDDIGGLKEEIEILETKRDYARNVVVELDRKYNALGLKESVLIPGGLFLMSILFSNWVILVGRNIIWHSASFFIALASLSFGVQKIIFSLQSVQEFSLNTKDEDQIKQNKPKQTQNQSKQIRDALVKALRVVEESKEPKPYITFKEDPPFLFKPNTEGVIKFEVNLKKTGNIEAKNVDAWFMFSPEIEILESTNYSAPFKQGPTHLIPNANTIIYKFDVVRKHTTTNGIIKIKTTAPGIFKLRYKVECDGHGEPSSSNMEIGIIVRE